MRRHRRVRNGREYKAGSGSPLGETIADVSLMGGIFFGLYTGNYWIMGLFLIIGLVKYFRG